MFKYKVNHKLRLIFLCNAEDTSVAECADFLTQFQQRHPEAVDYDTLNDVRHQPKLLSFEEVDEITELLKAFAGRQRKGAILAGEGIQFGVGRMFEQVSDGRTALESKVVATLAEAADWLGRPEAELAAAMESEGWIEIIHRP